MLDDHSSSHLVAVPIAHPPPVHLDYDEQHEHHQQQDQEEMKPEPEHLSTDQHEALQDSSMDVTAIAPPPSSITAVE
jgi:hypothetical protein